MSDFIQNSPLKSSDNDSPSFDYRLEFFKYFFYWKYFVVSILFFSASSYLFVRYSTKIYNTNAKIKIIDKKDSALELPSASEIFSNSKINLENEIEVLKSYPILKELCLQLDLHFSVSSIGNIKEALILKYPFTITPKVSPEKTKNQRFILEFYEKGLEITDSKNKKKKYLFNDLSTLKIKHNLPFEISNIDLKSLKTNSVFVINFHSIHNKILKLKRSINVKPIGANSDLINISLKNSNREYAEMIINTLIDIFNNDGVRDRQLIHKRTIDFVNDRYLSLTNELDSIEIYKQIYKAKNNVVDLTANTSVSLNKSTSLEESIFNNQNQIYIVNSLFDVLSNDLELLPSNIGIENLELNSLIQSYNESLLLKRKLESSAGPNNPSIKNLNNSINDSRKNIFISIDNYLNQLKLINNSLNKESIKFGDQLASIPFKEKKLRSIERNQTITEALYLFLLQKREEAEVSFAITEPSIKVVEYAISDLQPIFPKPRFIYILGFLIGLFVPFLVLFLRFFMDTKIHSKLDIENSSSDLNILGEIPFFDLIEEEKIFSNPEDRSIISESFRMLMSNVRYFQKIDSSSKSDLILVTSSIKGEGKTLNALNLALSFSSVGKKVLLMGLDLRNPQLHKYINHDKNVPGLVDFLVDNKVNWRKNLLSPFNNQNKLDILLSGPIPPNPLNLINNGNLNLLIEDAKTEYDCIIIDTAPTLLVADTKSLFKFADIIIYLIRCNVTDKDILNHIKNISNEVEANLGIVLNGVGQQNAYGYSYGYRYGYGYNYKYSYNYGYGYGYSSDDDES